jgi:regulator of RNase E activity RraA
MPPSRNVGFRVFRRIERPSAEMVEALGQLDTNFITDAMNRFGAMDNVAPAVPGMRLAGPAVTVRVPAASNLMVYQGFEVAQPGDVLVIETRGFTSVAVWGDLTSAIAQELRLAGMVTDGSVRDLRGIAEVGVPIFAREWSVANGALKHGPGEVNVPIAVAGVPVLPGDIVVADGGGVVVVPRQDAEAVLAGARAIAEAEARKLEDIRSGKLIPGWVHETLRREGCEITD